MLLTDVAIKNRTTVAVLGLLIILMGGYSYLTLPREAAPDIPIPFILVTTTYEGVSPEDMETSVTMKIEKLDQRGIYAGHTQRGGPAARPRPC